MNMAGKNKTVKPIYSTKQKKQPISYNKYITHLDSETRHYHKMREITYAFILGLKLI
jgi:hypothetical protein